ncbi:hypothetical protein Q4503_08350 [Colwellia sp. 6_MG-2023]|uniref:hypothetical protein n=1 Tax=Colwellia sp. 6_MG-2023 TaxID=3062676 RepID=UPI0026E25F3B|nr:hypothetical protein [Colwellia sp. 6_MG-2023]MDO6487707.1 hypothetical protein [Colwellia sp. 6_MG-2023]
MSSVTTFFLLVISHMLILIIIDPISISKVELVDKEFYIKEMRFQAAGIINNTSFDSAIVGTSMAENFNVGEASELLGGGFVNLSLPGGLLKEREIILKYLLAEHDMKTIIISLDGATDLQRNKGVPLDAWSYLYNDSYLDDLTLYTNSKYLPYVSCHSFFNNKVSAVVLGECPEEKTRKSIGELTEWQSLKSHNSRFGGIDKWERYKNNAQVKVSIDSIIEAELILDKKLNRMTNVDGLYDYEQFSRYILPLVRNHPNTKFILFFPAYSLAKYAIDYQTNRDEFDDYKAFVKKVALNSDNYENIDLYWFNDHDFVEDISNYKDLTHYSAEFNSIFLNDFMIKKSIMNAHNYNTQLLLLEKKAKEFDLKLLAETFKSQ